MTHNIFEKQIKINSFVSLAADVVTLVLDSAHPPGQRVFFDVDNVELHGKVVNSKKENNSFIVAVRINTLSKKDRLYLETLPHI